MYASDHWLQEWASAGWLVPLNTVFPAEAVEELTAGMFPYTLQGMTYNGEIYGLPYYSDPISFVYNTRLYEEAGITDPPRIGTTCLNTLARSKRPDWWSIPSASAGRRMSRSPSKS
jgi:ABC-type glycerol-3-phosphate transport system substrate-binding protein